MKRVVIVLLLLTAVVTAVLVYYALDRPAPEAAHLLPESTFLFVDIPNFPQARADFAKTELYALWHEPEMQSFLEQPLTALRDALAQWGAPQEKNELANVLLDAMQGEVFFAITRITVFPTFNPGLVLGVDVRHKRIQTAAGLRTLESRLKQSYPQGKFQDKKYLGVKYSMWETQPGVQICQASLHSLVVFALGEDTLRDVIACYAGQPPRDFEPLAASAKYQNVLRHASQNNEFLAFLNVEELLNLIGPLLALAPQTSGMYQNFARFRASAASMTFLDGGVEDIGFVAYSSATPKPTPATHRKTLALTTPETLVYAVGSADMATTYNTAMQSLSQSGNANLMLATTQFQQALRSRGFRIREEVLQKLGPEFAIITRWRTGAPAPDFAVVGEIADAATTRPALDGVMNALKETALGDDIQFPWDETEFAGQKLRTVHVGTGILAPTYVTTDQFFILASTPDDARELLAQARDAKPTLARSELYVQSMKRLPANGSSYIYADLRGLFEPLYASGKLGMSKMDTNAFVDMTKLPRSETIARHLFPFVSATVTEPQQETTISFSPFGKPLLLAAGVGGAIWVGHEFGPTLQQYATPALPKRSSGTVVPSAPRENQTATSQIPATQ